MAASPNQSRALAMRATRRSLPTVFGIGCRVDLGTLKLDPRAERPCFFYERRACGENALPLSAPARSDWRQSGEYEITVFRAKHNRDNHTPRLMSRGLGAQKKSVVGLLLADVEAPPKFGIPKEGKKKDMFVLKREGWNG